VIYEGVEPIDIDRIVGVIWNRATHGIATG
jgi:hypothetical protein